MSGEIKLELEKIIWVYENENIVEIYFDEIFIIGEYTIDSIFDDWFIVFVSRDGSWEKISMFAENIDLLLNALSDKYNIEVGQTQLANSTKWNSIISFPNSIRGKKLFNLVKNKIELDEDIKEYFLPKR
ncbi:MAG: hypothetical protein O9267_13405 [Flavobacterium sp.]|uniref:hypothetical protein n=1 Tax=Flavobacterium sp. TaxID=239 RepID=UPI0022C8F616|nr:hypothetical protein [Flavobacterium sp.]MCZ8198594.1 hypothetical protein [Flavobacterium sp.]